MFQTRGPLWILVRPSAAFIVPFCMLIAACGGGGGYSAPPPPPMTGTVMLSVAPTAIVAGQTATLTWSSTVFTSCSASGAWTGSEPTGGSMQVTPTASGSAAYTITCSVSGGGYSGGMSSMAATATLTVNPSPAFKATSLVADGTGAHTSDANLVNAWGLVFGPTNPVWIANNGTQTSTLYDGNGLPFDIPNTTTQLVVNLPANFNPNGIVFNASSTDFQVKEGSGTPASAAFIFSGEAGMIAGWAPAVDLTHAVVAYADANGAVYKGLTLASNGGSQFLYAADFHGNKIDVFDHTFAKQASSASSFAFADPTLPANFAPFNIQAFNNGANGATQIYVAYAQHGNGADNADGAGLGLINIFDTNGNLVKHLVPMGGALNAPWGMALAPSDFGALSLMLLVANFGDGKINAFDPNSGAFVAPLTVDVNGTPFVSDGLWGIAFGNDHQNQPHNTLFFTAGPGGEAHGLYGRIDPPM